MEGEKSVLLEKSRGIAIVTLNRPGVLNTLHPVLIAETLEAFQDVDQDPDVKVVILTGAGKGFCAGGDLPYIEAIDNPVKGRDYIAYAGEITSAIVNLKKPVIAMVNGVAAGAGFNLALACDIIYCAKSARFVQSFAKVGLVPDCGGAYLLPRAVGLHKAKELMFTADIISSDTAFQLGFVNQVVEDAELKAATFKYAEKLAASAPIAISLIKKILNESDGLDLKKVLEMETFMQSMCLQTEDNKEGVKAFKEKRAPVFKGR